MTLREKIGIIPRKLIDDERGWFLKILTGTEPGIDLGAGEVYAVMASPGEVRGNHYHRAADEWFTLLNGSALFRFCDPQTMETLDMDVSFGECATVFVPHGVAHAIQSKPGASESMVVVAFSSLRYNPDDTVPFTLFPAAGLSRTDEPAEKQDA